MRAVITATIIDAGICPNCGGQLTYPPYGVVCPRCEEIPATVHPNRRRRADKDKMGHDVVRECQKPDPLRPFLTLVDEISALEYAARDAIISRRLTHETCATIRALVQKALQELGKE